MVSMLDAAAFKFNSIRNIAGNGYPALWRGEATHGQRSNTTVFMRQSMTMNHSLAVGVDSYKVTVWAIPPTSHESQYIS